jgi:hypothetical protein
VLREIKSKRRESARNDDVVSMLNAIDLEVSNISNNSQFGQTGKKKNKDSNNAENEPPADEN